MLSFRVSKKLVMFITLLLMVIAYQSMTVRDENNVYSESSKQNSIHDSQGIIERSPIYFVAHNSIEEIIELWKIGPDEINGLPIMRFPSHYPLLSLPPQELASLNHNICDKNGEICSQANLSYAINEVQLSPDGYILAWLDATIWCPNTGCYGFQRIVYYDIETGLLQTLLEKPIHVDLNETQEIASIQWSPDNREISFVIRNARDGWSYVNVINLHTAQVSNLGEGMAPVVWSSSGGSMAFPVWVSPEEQAIKIVSTTGEESFLLNGGWNSVSGLSWSPDSKQLAVTAWQKEKHEAPIYELYVVELSTSRISAIEIPSIENLSYSHPQWSPDGRFVGISGSKEVSYPANVLLVLEKDNWDVNSQYFRERIDDVWYWSPDGQSILLKLGGTYSYTDMESLPYGIGILDWQRNEIDEIGFPKNIRNMLDKWQLSILSFDW